MSRDDFTALTQFASPDPGEQKVDIRRDFTTPERGAATQVWAAVSAELADVGSVYLADCRIQDDPRGPAPYATNAAHAVRLWEVSERLCSGAGR
jgi:hypothetical protein